MFEENTHFAPAEGTGASGATPNETSAEEQNQRTAVDWSSVDVASVPEDVVKQHPLFKKVLAESIERRKALKERDQKIAELLNGDDGEKPKDDKPVTQPNDAEMPAWARELRQAFEGLVKTSSEATLKLAREAAVAEFGLTEQQAEFLSGSSPDEIKANAAKLAAAFNLPKASAGNAGSQSPTDSLAARLRERIQQSIEPIKNPSIFDPGVQRQDQGGTIY